VDSLNVGGGIWRIKQQPPQPGGSSSSNDDALLIAAMHGGFLVLTKDAGGCRSPVLLHTIVAARYTEHESLAYGADWLGAGLVASCSFYDHVLKIWTV
jgi:diphthamide biosynthesis protein 7